MSNRKPIIFKLKPSSRLSLEQAIKRDSIKDDIYKCSENEHIYIDSDGVIWIRLNR